MRITDCGTPSTVRCRYHACYKYATNMLCYAMLHKNTYIEVHERGCIITCITITPWRDERIIFPPRSMGGCFNEPTSQSVVAKSRYDCNWAN